MSGRYDSPLAPEQIAAVRDEDIDFSDIPELDEDFWRRAELVEADRTDRTIIRVKRSAPADSKAPG
ncbi:MAG: 3-oxoacyl-ACP synthase [Gemmatimonadetes bacterium]|nr:3-oxoacyl-ACP synthase [Gemmatimonadota bacterium]